MQAVVLLFESNRVTLQYVVELVSILLKSSAVVLCHHKFEELLTLKIFFVHFVNELLYELIYGVV